MHLQLDSSIAANYRSAPQRVRVITEAWGATELYCAACESNSLTRSAPNSKVCDFECPQCDSVFELKSGATWSKTKVPDSAYSAMMAAIESDRVPNLFVLQYTKDWRVRNLMLIPKFFFVPSVIERRKPLPPTARRAGWVGCNILLTAIVDDGKLPIVNNGESLPPEVVRASYRRVQPLARLKADVRGWTMDVLRVVRRLGKQEFGIEDVYAQESIFSAIYPNNRNIRPKIRQQLQVLRDVGLIQFLGRGRYRVL